MNCLICGCSEFAPCVDGASQETCGWAQFAPGVITLTGVQGICSFCAEVNAPLMEDLARNVHAGIVNALRLGHLKPPDEPRLIELATDAEVNEILRTRRASL